MGAVALGSSAGHRHWIVSAMVQDSGAAGGEERLCGDGGELGGMVIRAR
jgi:hypothetical protein